MGTLGTVIQTGKLVMRDHNRNQQAQQREKQAAEPKKDLNANYLHSYETTYDDLDETWPGVLSAVTDGTLRDKWQLMWDSKRGDEKKFPDLLDKARHDSSQEGEIRKYLDDLIAIRDLVKKLPDRCSRFLEVESRYREVRKRLETAQRKNQKFDLDAHFTDVKNSLEPDGPAHDFDHDLTVLKNACEFYSDELDKDPLHSVKPPSEGDWDFHAMAMILKECKPDECHIDNKHFRQLCQNLLDSTMSGKVFTYEDACSIFRSLISHSQLESWLTKAQTAVGKLQKRLEFKV